MELDIRFCRTSDGVRIAYGVLGSGPPLIFVPGWVSHLEIMWEFSETRAWIESLARDFTFVTLDKRGTGLSQRAVGDYSWAARARDIEAVADHAGLDRFALAAISEGCIGAMQFAGEHPERVTHLVLQGIARQNPHTLDLLQGVISVIKAEWGLGSKLMSDVLLGENAPPEWQDWFVRMQREGATAEDAEAMMAANINPPPDAPATVARITCPKLMINGRNDNVAPVEDARSLAAAMGAKYISIEGGHVPMGPGQWEAVRRATVEFILSRHEEPAPSAPAAPARTTSAAPGAAPITIMFTDMESSTATTQRLGDAAAQNLVRAHNTVVRDALKQHDGNEIKHTGDGIMASFAAASSAVDCAIAIQRALADRTDAPRVRIGINAGEPVAEEGDLYGTSVQLAARVCAHAEAGQIVASNVIRELTAGKKFLYADLGDVAMRGFEDPVRLYEVRWGD